MALSPFRASIVLAAAVCAAMVVESGAQTAPHSGLRNFALVNNQLYRGGQPENPGFAELKKLGVAIVVNLRHEPAEIARERALVEAQGMRYVSIPWRGKQDPNTEQVAQFLQLIRDNPDGKVFVHCERGAERTGVMVACYRISRDRWTPDQALDEMEKFGFRGLRFGHLKRFVRGFPALLLRDPFLQSAASTEVRHDRAQDRPVPDRFLASHFAADRPGG